MTVLRSVFGTVCGLLFLFQLLFCCLFTGTVLLSIARLVFWVFGERFSFLSEGSRSYVFYLLQLNIIAYAQKVAGLRIVLYGDDIGDRQVSSLVICNHRSWLDSIVLSILLLKKQTNALCRYLGKMSVGCIPMLGWMTLNTGALISLSRKWQTDKEKLQTTFRRLQNADRDFWVLTYPEGTRFSLEKKSLSQQFAKNHNLTLFQNVLIPRFKGFFTCISILRSRISFLYNATIMYEGGEDSNGVTRMNLAKVFFLRRVFMETSKDDHKKIKAVVLPVTHIHVEKVPMQDVPTEEDKCHQFLISLFEKKEKLIQKFKETGSFGTRKVEWNQSLSVQQLWQATVLLWSLSLLGFYISLIFLNWFKCILLSRC
eukprot:jgi/Galph1/338/GphlegSOOS_G5077.1